MNWFRRTCNESKITSFYWLYTMIIMQSTGLLNTHNLLLFALLCFSSKPAWYTGHENPPNKCAEITCQKNPPVKYAVKIARFMHDYNLLNLLTGKTRNFNSRLLLAREPPLPRSESPGKTWPAIPVNTLVIRSSLKDWQSMKNECILTRHNFFFTCNLQKGRSGSRKSLQHFRKLFTHDLYNFFTFLGTFLTFLDLDT